MTISQILMATAASSFTLPLDSGVFIWDGRNYNTGIFQSSSSEQYALSTLGSWMGPDLSVDNGSWGGTVNSYLMNFANDGVNYNYGYTTPNLNGRGNWRYDNGYSNGSNTDFTLQFWFYVSSGHVGSVLCGLTDSVVYTNNILEISTAGYINAQTWLVAYPEGNSSTAVSTTTVNVDSWNHVIYQVSSASYNDGITTFPGGKLTISLNNDIPTIIGLPRGANPPIDPKFVFGVPQSNPMTAAGEVYYYGKIAYIQVDNRVISTSFVVQQDWFFNTYTSPALGNGVLGGSLYFNGSTTSYLQVPITSTGLRFAPETSDFTIEWWQYQVSGGSAYPYTFSIYNPSTSTTQMYVFVQSDEIYYADSGTGGNIVLGSASGKIIDQWAHIAIVRTSGYMNCYVNGMVINDTGSRPNTSNISNLGPSGAKFIIGGLSDVAGDITASTALKGYLTNFNFINGLAKYTGNFTPSAIPFTVEAGVVTKMLLLASTDATKIYDTAASHNVLSNHSITWSNYSPYMIPNLWLDSGDSRSWTNSGINYTFPTAISQDTSPYNWTNHQYGANTISLFPASPPVTPQNGWTISDGTTTRTITNVNYTGSAFGNIYIITFDSNADYSAPTSITITDPTLIWHDLGIGAHNATFPNSVTYSASNSGILHFVSESSQYATLTSPGLAEKFTVNVWTKLDNLPSGTQPTIFTETFATNINYTIGFLEDSGHIKGGFFVGSWKVAGNFVPSTATWYNFTVTYDGASIKFYLNGSINQTSSYVGTAQSSSTPTAYIGHRWDNAEFIDGYIPVVQVFKYALTDTEVSALYSHFSARY